MTTYGSAFAEKQKMKHYYGVREAQFRRYFELARKTKGNTGQTLMLLCSDDSTTSCDGLVSSTPVRRRQGIVHSHFQLNGRTVSTPSIVVNAGDVITVRNRPNLQNMYRLVVESSTLPRSNGSRSSGRPQGDCDLASRFKRYQCPGRHRSDRDLHGTLTFGSSPSIPAVGNRKTRGLRPIEWQHIDAGLRMPLS